MRNKTPTEKEKKSNKLVFKALNKISDLEMFFSFMFLRGACYLCRAKI